MPFINVTTQAPARNVSPFIPQKAFQREGGLKPGKAPADDHDIYSFAEVSSHAAILAQKKKLVGRIVR